jgi:hypothetical protein
MIEIPIVTVLHRYLVTEVIEYLKISHIIADKLWVHEWYQSVYQIANPLLFLIL